MARHRTGYGRSRVSGGFVASAVAAGLLLAAHNSHAATGHGGSVQAAGAAIAVPRDSDIPLAFTGLARTRVEGGVVEQFGGA